MTALTAADLTRREIDVVKSAANSAGWITATTWEESYWGELRRLEKGGMLEHRPQDLVRRYVLTDLGVALAEELGR